MAPPLDTAQPRLAAGCRWGGSEQNRMVLFPEGAIRIEGTGRKILEACDGVRSLRQIVEELQAHYTGSDSERIRQDVTSFLEALHAKRIVDY
jgi:pyrroloquinoline quinone biosynthesis protein D